METGFTDVAVKTKNFRILMGLKLIWGQNFINFSKKNSRFRQKIQVLLYFYVHSPQLVYKSDYNQYLYSKFKLFFLRFAFFQPFLIFSFFHQFNDLLFYIPTSIDYGDRITKKKLMLVWCNCLSKFLSRFRFYKEEKKKTWEHLIWISNLLNLTKSANKYS